MLESFPISDWAWLNPHWFLFSLWTLAESLSEALNRSWEPQEHVDSPTIAYYKRNKIFLNCISYGGIHKWRHTPLGIFDPTPPLSCTYALGLMLPRNALTLPLFARCNLCYSAVTCKLQLSANLIKVWYSMLFYQILPEDPNIGQKLGILKY